MNTVGTGTYSQVWRSAYASKMLQMALRSALVAEAVCKVDKSDSHYIHSPYISTTQSAAVNTSGKVGTYSVSSWTTAEDSLTVSEEFTYAVHIFDFEQRLATMDMFRSFTEELSRAVAEKVDQFVVNELCEDGSGTYDTPTGGFTTAANWTIILSNLYSKVAGYRGIGMGAGSGHFLILEAQDLVGVLQSQMASGFNFADTALRNGLVSNQAGVDIYVVKNSTFVDDAAGASGYSGTQTWTNDGHRVFGVKGIATFAMPGGIHYKEIEVSSKTGKEIAVWAYAGVKVWNKTASLIVDITIK